MSEEPPRTHNLDFLIQAIPGGVPDRFEDLMDLLEDISVKVRYPPVLDLLLHEITADVAKKIFEDTGEFLTWIRESNL